MVVAAPSVHHTHLPILPLKRKQLFSKYFFQLSSSQSSNGLSIVIALNRSHNSPLSLKCTIVFRSLLIHCVLEILQPHPHLHPPQHLHNHLPDKLFSVHYLPIVSRGYTLEKWENENQSEMFIVKNLHQSQI